MIKKYCAGFASKTSAAEANDVLQSFFFSELHQFYTTKLSKTKGTRCDAACQFCQHMNAMYTTSNTSLHIVTCQLFGSRAYSNTLLQVYIIKGY